MKRILDKMNIENLQDGDIQRLKNISRLILDLTEHPGWSHFVQAVRSVIETECTYPSELKNAEQTLQVASKAVFAAGLQRALVIPKQYQDFLEAMEAYPPVELD